MSRTLARGLTALCIAGLGTFGLTGTAMAVDCGAYPTASTCLPTTTDKSTVGDGGQVSGTFLAEPNSTGPEYLQLTRGGPRILLGYYQANAQGVVNWTVTIPEGTAPGDYNLLFPATLGSGASVTYIAEITVINDEAGGGAGGGLPLTGAEIGAASLLGAGLLGAGTIAVIATRRRKVGAVA